MTEAFESALNVGDVVEILSLFTILILGLASILVIYTMLPIFGIISRIDTLDLTSLLSSETTSAMLLSLETATASTAICIVFGLPLAYLIARSKYKARSTA